MAVSGGAAGEAVLARQERGRGGRLPTHRLSWLVAASGVGGVKLLVAIEPRSYREAIGTFFRDVRQSLDVSIVDPKALEAEVERSAPDLVFSSRSNARAKRRWPAWLEFQSETYGQAVVLYLDGSCFELEDTDLGDLLSIVDRTERVLAQSPGTNGY